MMKPRVTTDPDGTTRTWTADSPKGRAKAAAKKAGRPEHLAHVRPCYCPSCVGD